VTSRDVTASLHGVIFEMFGNTSETNNLRPNELLELLRGLQWQRA
jgi:hypothetical protein